MISSHPTGSGNLFSSGIDPKTNCTYCKEEGHHYKACPKLKAKKEREAKEGKKTKPTYPNCPTCDKTNHPAERCWKGAGAHLKKRKARMRIKHQPTIRPTKKNPQKILLPHQKHQHPYSRIRFQKTNIATTPNLPSNKN